MTRLDLARAFEAHLGLSLRRDEVGRLLGRLRRPRAAWCDVDQTLVVVGLEPAAEREWIGSLAGALAAIAPRPLTPKLVVSAVGFSNSERLRWTKDPRLPSSGTVQIRRGQLISVPTYAVAVVERLRAERPSGSRGDAPPCPPPLMP